MINLMPDDAKKELRAARVNVLLIRYMGVIFAAFTFLVFILFGSYFLLNQSKSSSEQLIAANDTKADVYKTTREQINTLSDQLAGAKAILNKEVLYSDVLVDIGQRMTPGTIIDKISLTAASFSGTATTLKVFAKTTNDAVALRDSFQQSSLFKNVSFQTVSDSNSGVVDYPVSATLTLTLDGKTAQ